MDQETIENHIKGLGTRDFGALVSVILTKFFHLKAIDVDGKGDGGSDYRVFSDSHEASVLAIQRTVQEAQWQQKAFDDAQKAVRDLKAERYFFLTSRAHESTSLRSVENRIAAELQIPATCLGATELAGVIVEQKLIREFAEAIGLQLDLPVAERPDKVEIILHAYAALGSDRNELRNGVYDDTILLALHVANDSLSRSSLLSSAAKLIEASHIAEDRLTGRIDSLMTRGVIAKGSDGLLRLSELAKLNLAASDGVYEKELSQLGGAQAQLLHDECGLDWSAQQCAEAATSLSRWFIQRQLSTAEHFSVELSKMGWSRVLGEPEADLRRLVKAAGVDDGKVSRVLNGFVQLASGLPLIAKLTRAITYVATEGTDLLRASRVLGASAWSEVTVTLDASVAIPFLCSSMFAPTAGRFSRGANASVSLLRKAGAKLVIPRVYINEVSAHLVRALSYPDMPELEQGLQNSQNGFVAHYYQLRAAQQPVPPTIKEFISQFSGDSMVNINAPQEAIRTVMARIQPLLADHGVLFDDASRVPDHFRKKVETTFTYHMERLKRAKSPMLVDHDVLALAHSRRCVSERNEKRMCLTWDATMIEVSRELTDCGLVISPQEAADIVQQKLRMGAQKLMALAHSLARVQERPSEIGARIIDRVTQLASEHLQDWQFRKRLQDFYGQAISRVDPTSDSYLDIDREIDGFLEQEGIKTNASDVESSE